MYNPITVSPRALGIAAAPHRRLDPRLAQAPGIANRDILHAPIADAPGPCQSHDRTDALRRRIQGQIAPQRLGCPPADDAARLAHIIHQRMDQIFDLVPRDIQSSGYLGEDRGRHRAQGRRGGIAGMGELAADLFGAAMRVAVPRENITGLADAVEAPRLRSPA